MNYEEYFKGYKELIEKLLSGNFDQATQKERDQPRSRSSMPLLWTSVAVSFIPIPFIEAPIQITMVRAIGKVYGQELDENSYWKSSQ